MARIVGGVASVLRPWGLVLLLGAGALPAAAQPDPMEEQRCVWRCLAQSRGNTDPAYDACVRAQCMRPSPAGRSKSDHAPPPPRPPRAAPPPRSEAWKTVTDLAYPAVAQCLPLGRAGNLCLVVGCPARGALSLEVYGLEHGLTGAPLRLSTPGSLFDLRLPDRAPAEDAYRWPMPIGLAPALKAESAVDLEVNGRTFRMSLAGSGAAIGDVEARCR